MDSESDLDMTEMCPQNPPATREVPAAEPSAGTVGGCGRQPPTSSVSPGRVDFGCINGSNISSDDSLTSSDSSDSSNNSDSGDPSALVGRSARGVEGFGEFLAHCRADARGPNRWA